jgi:hypothetical protein
MKWLILSTLCSITFLVIERYDCKITKHQWKICSLETPFTHVTMGSDLVVTINYVAMHQDNTWQFISLTGNVAYNKTASASNYNRQRDWAPILAIDGGVDRAIVKGKTCFGSFETPKTAKSWWMVDLGGEHVIHNITLIIPDLPVFKKRLHDFRLSVSKDSVEFKECAYHVNHFNDKVTLPCQARGRYVKLINGQRFANHQRYGLCEVIVIGYKVISEYDFPYIRALIIFNLSRCFDLFSFRSSKHLQACKWLRMYMHSRIHWCKLWNRYVVVFQNIILPYQKLNRNTISQNYYQLLNMFEKISCFYIIIFE